MQGLLARVSRSTALTLAAIAALIAAAVAVAVEGFALTIFGALALYFVLWWTFLFAVLPLGNATETDPGRVIPGQDPGAPALPRLRFKALLTTLIAGVAFFVAIVVFPLARL